MAIGNWGAAIVFNISELSSFTFKDTSRTVGSDWATHSRVGLKNQVEYLRPALQKMSFTISLDATLGVKTRDVIERMAAMSEHGEVHPFVVGCRRVGNYRWRITSISEAWETIYNRGELTNAKLDITMEEYL